MEIPGFDELFVTYEKPLYNYILRMVKERQLAEDLVQDVFVKIYQNLENFRGNSKLSTWIYQIATNTYLDYFRTAAHKKEMKTDQLTDYEDKETKFKDLEKILSIDEQFVKDEMSACVREFLYELPGDYRTAIVLHDLQGLKNREIAEIMDCSLDTVKIRLHRARNKFKMVLLENCTFYKDPNDVLCCDRKENCQ